MSSGNFGNAGSRQIAKGVAGGVRCDCSGAEAEGEDALGTAGRMPALRGDGEVVAATSLW